MTHFRAVAVLAVAARTVVRSVYAGIAGFVATIDRATDAIAAGHGRSRLAALCRMADFRAVAIKTVAAGSVVGRVFAAVGDRVARVHGARDAVIAGGRRPRNAPAVAGVARFRSVAENPIVALRIVCTRNAAVTRFLAMKRWIAGVVIILTTQRWIADFLPVAEQAVLAGGIIGRVGTLVGGFIAAVGRAVDVVVTIRGRSRPAPLCQLANLGPVAEQSVATGGVISRMGARIRRLVAPIDGAAYAIAAVGRGSRLATLRCAANLSAIAIEPVATERIAGLVATGIARFVAGVDRAGNRVIAIWRCS